MRLVQVQTWKIEVKPSCLLVLRGLVEHRALLQLLLVGANLMAFWMECGSSNSSRSYSTSWSKFSNSWPRCVFSSVTTGQVLASEENLHHQNHKLGGDKEPIEDTVNSFILKGSSSNSQLPVYICFPQSITIFPSQLPACKHQGPALDLETKLHIDYFFCLH